MIGKLDITNPIVAEKVLNVQIPSYRVEAELIGFYELPPLKDTVETLRQCGEMFFGYFLNKELCGVISVRVEQNVLDIHRLIVHPQHFRKGIANALMEFIQNKFENVESIIVSTGAKNTPAVTFYEKNGFLKTEEIKINENLILQTFKKDILVHKKNL
ncbi:MAG TPA: GNAT family N-acetyltransferase [Pseudoneobacillus sp.]|nr:GNAT family N-acetyltransferase [Pseudoneobacillus sp.]